MGEKCRDPNKTIHYFPVAFLNLNSPLLFVCVPHTCAKRILLFSRLLVQFGYCIL